MCTNECPYCGVRTDGINACASCASEGPFYHDGRRFLEFAIAFGAAYRVTTEAASRLAPSSGGRDDASR